MAVQGLESSVQAAIVFKKIRELSALDVVTFASVFLLLRFGFVDAWYFRLAVDFALVLVIISRLKIVYHWGFWLLAALLASFALIMNWDTEDNHKYLFVYWMWMMTLVYFARETEFRNLFIRFNARYFLVLIFLGAALQKFLSPTYMSGEMFELITVLDGRFRAFAVLVGIDVQTLDSLKLQFANITNPAVELAENQITLALNDYIIWVAKWITWYDLYVQVLIGVLLIFGRRFTDFWGHIVLLFFIFTTYIPAPVFGFGWTLSTMGIALAWNKFPRISLLYLISFLAILIYQIPWRTWVLGTA